MRQFITFYLGLLLAFGVVSAETVYYENDFESGTAGEAPKDIKIHDLDGNANAYTFMKHAWQYYNDNGSFTSSMTLISSSKYSNNGNSDDWAIFPKITVGEAVTLSFVEATISDAPESFEVLISKTGDAVEDFTTVVYTGDPATNHTTVDHDNWNQVVIDLSSFGVDNSDIYIALHNNTMGGGNALFIDNFKVYTLEALDVAMKGITIPAYADINSELPLDIKGILKNVAADVLTSVELKYHFKDEEIQSIQISDINVSFNENYQFTIPGWTTESLGVGTLKVWVSLINGVEDPTAENNEATAPLTIYDKSQTYERNTLIEVFTSATCPPCKPGNEVLGSILSSPEFEGKYTKVNYQMRWPGAGDKYYNADGGLRRTYYAVSAVPETHVDGIVKLNPNYFTAQTMEDALSVPAFVNIDMDAEISGKDIAITLTITSAFDMELPNMRAFVSINETRTVNNRASNGETEFFDVEQKMLPSGTGTRVDKLTADEPFVIELTYSFDSTSSNVENFDNLYAIAFLQDMNTQEVFNSAVPTSAEPEVFNILDFTVTPNPIDDNATITYNVAGSAVYNVDVKLFDIKGNVVSDLQSAQIGSGMQTVRFDAALLAQGTYFVVLNINGSQVVKQLVVRK
ncbi:MAG: choice-of-anchor J domain-containing protein [Candidatus Kapabacteria bacterium]|jgi:hypothetical protein|nr:choice-of-anchor J domain-containing protein [Candidatus Kapabacteria bacterium]